MAENIYNWQYNTIPGNANQGAILMTRNDITQPPFNQTDFIWKAMEDIIGVANVKFEYDEINNKYHIFKATGHRDNNGNWTYNWEEFGSWDALPEEVVETLRMLKYVEYIFDTSIPNTLKVSGKKKDGTIELLTNISFASTQYVDQKVLDLIQDNLTTALNKTWSIDKIKSYIDTIGHFNYKGAINRDSLPTVAAKGDVYKVNEENDLYVNVSSTNASNFVPFTDIADAFTTYAIELHKSNNGLYAKLRYDTIDFMIDNAYNLKSILIDDTLDAGDPYANRKTYSIDKILSLLSSSMRYKGQVNYYDLLPTTGNVAGDTWNVIYEGPSSGGSTELDGDNYCWNGTNWDDLSGEYRAGVGIVIQGKTISSTGINFRVGSGLKITGSGNNATLETRNGDGLEYQNVGTTADPVYANKVKPKTNGGILVDSNGVSVIPNTNNGIQITSNGVEAKLGYGMEFGSTGNIKILPNKGITVAAEGASVKLASNEDTLYFDKNNNLKCNVTSNDIYFNDGDIINCAISLATVFIYSNSKTLYIGLPLPKRLRPGYRTILWNMNLLLANSQNLANYGYLRNNTGTYTALATTTPQVVEGVKVTPFTQLEFIETNPTPSHFRLDITTPNDRDVYVIDSTGSQLYTPYSTFLLVNSAFQLKVVPV